jgi:hypothetical protein
MKIKVSEASGPVLDWMVAKCEGAEFHCVDGVLCVLWSEEFDVRLTDYNPSTDWAQGGPIIGREKIDFWTGDSYQDEYGKFTAIKSAKHPASAMHYEGPTPLIAAMRCYVASKLGNECEVPDELTN